MQLGEKPETWLPRIAALKERARNGNGHGMPLTIAAQIGPTWRLEQGNSCPCRCHTSTSSAAASPARTSASPAREQGSTGLARVFGQSTPVSLASYDPATSSWRTSQLSLLEEWAEFSETWPRAGMTRNGTAFQLQPLAPLTRGTASGSLPTIRATDADRGGRGDLIQAVRGNSNPHFRLPTPNSRDWKDSGPSQGHRKSPNLGTVAHWRTPQAGEGGQDARTRAAQGHSVYLRDQMKEVEGSGQLNPTWVEWLMGFPLNWTSLGD